MHHSFALISLEKLYFFNLEKKFGIILAILKKIQCKLHHIFKSVDVQSINYIFLSIAFVFTWCLVTLLIFKKEYVLFCYGFSFFNYANKTNLFDFDKFLFIPACYIWNTVDIRYERNHWNGNPEFESYLNFINIVWSFSLSVLQHKDYNNNGV